MTTAELGLTGAEYRQLYEDLRLYARRYHGGTSPTSITIATLEKLARKASAEVPPTGLVDVLGDRGAVLKYSKIVLRNQAKDYWSRQNEALVEADALSTLAALTTSSGFLPASSFVGGVARTVHMAVIHMLLERYAGDEGTGSQQHKRRVAVLGFEAKHVVGLDWSESLEQVNGLIGEEGGEPIGESTLRRQVKKLKDWMRERLAPTDEAVDKLVKTLDSDVDRKVAILHFAEELSIDEILEQMPSLDETRVGEILESLYLRLSSLE